MDINRFLFFFQTLHRDSEIKDISNKKMRAMDVFSICIKHLKDSMLEEMEKTKTFDISEKDVDFILTVPAIWGDAAKMFMREAAVKVILFVDLGGMQSLIKNTLLWFVSSK